MRKLIFKLYLFQAQDYRFDNFYGLFRYFLILNKKKLYFLLYIFFLRYNLLRIQSFLLKEEKHINSLRFHNLSCKISEN